MKPSGLEYDDFTAIKGIGIARSQWLQESFDIHTYQELASLKVSKIETQLKAEGKIVARSAIEDWIEQARQLSSVTNTHLSIRHGAPSSDLVHKINTTANQNGWMPFASFLVYFQSREVKAEDLVYQTLVHYMEKDHETSWPGIEVSSVCDWMSEQIREQIEILKSGGAKETIEEKKAVLSEIEPPDIKIERVSIYQPASAHTPVHRITQGEEADFKDELQANESFRFVVDCTLRDAAKQVSKAELTCLARCYVYDKLSKMNALLAESDHQILKTDKFDYSFKIPETSLSAGSYRIILTVTSLEASRLIPDFLEFISLNVVE